MSQQMDFQRMVIRSEYIKESEINEAVSRIITVAASPAMRKGIFRSERGVASSMGKRVAENGARRTNC
ncbi:hypothetical protein [Bacillus infantis]|uniref:hypothetical protein n=1 Tax=Bacillus infantis TaxID=324767 RepID=UPI003219097E